MTLYFLQKDKASERLMIDIKNHSEFKLEQALDACCWIEAKKNFGFELTGLQEVLLESALIRGTARRLIELNDV